MRLPSSGGDTTDCLRDWVSIESHFTDEISLEDIAAACDVSCSFGLGTGRSVVRYAGGRRLTEAARALSPGAPDIQSVALDLGYGSHEAFTRAFRDQFGVTPDAVRQLGDLTNPELVEPMNMTDTSTTHLEEPRRETCGPLLVAGLRERYTEETIAGIPRQWQRFGPYIGTIKGRIGGIGYGVCCDFDELGHFDYVCGVAVTSVADLPPELNGVCIPAGEYLVFRHRGHVSGIAATWRAIMNTWLPASGLRTATAPNFERYAEDFDPNTGMGGIEIRIPIEA